MAGKECPSCLGCAGTLHACTPTFVFGAPSGEIRIKSNEALRECVGLNSRPLFSAAEIESGYVCRHARDMADAQYLKRNKRKREPRGRGRPRKDACLGPPDTGALCRFCTCPLLKHKLVARVGIATCNVSDAACTMAGLPRGTRGCDRCRQAMGYRVRKAEAEKQRACCTPPPEPAAASGAAAATTEFDHRPRQVLAGGDAGGGGGRPRQQRRRHAQRRAEGGGWQ